MGLNTWFEKGMTPNTYTESLEFHKDYFAKIYEHFTPPADEEFFQLLNKKNLRVIVLAEPWCGHCMLNIPILMRLSEIANMPVRVLARDENVTLMDSYLTNGNRTIPIFIFIDENGNEVSKWGPITKKTREYVNEHRSILPPKDDKNYQDAFKQLTKQTAKSFSEDQSFWEDSYEDMKQTLKRDIA